MSSDERWWIEKMGKEREKRENGGGSNRDLWKEKRGGEKG